VRYLVALSLGSVCLVTLAAGLSIERGASVIGIAVVAGVLSLVALADGTLRRLRATRSSPAAR
jgi:hypothetical protein